MPLFHPDNCQKSDRHKQLAAAYELLCTFIEFSAAALFFVGSIMFFSSAWENMAIWLFVIGSAFFALSPTMKLVREIHYLKLGDIDALAERGNK